MLESSSKTLYIIVLKKCVDESIEGIQPYLGRFFLMANYK